MGVGLAGMCPVSCSGRADRAGRFDPVCADDGKAAVATRWYAPGRVISVESGLGEYVGSRRWRLPRM
ncbi:hypothetical protein GCM10010300_77520 [Streptomyces olivaceoviridis]|nr:hypothetical protein GCM10010300_77520 [Streptomyces olivaceoviridis]